MKSYFTNDGGHLRVECDASHPQASHEGPYGYSRPAALLELVWALLAGYSAPTATAWEGAQQLHDPYSPCQDYGEPVDGWQIGPFLLEMPSPDEAQYYLIRRGERIEGDPDELAEAYIASWPEPACIGYRPNGWWQRPTETSAGIRHVDHRLAYRE